MWQRWNGTSHIFEKSDDNGSSWAPLPLNAATVNEGLLSVARMASLLNTANNWTADQTLTNCAVKLAGTTVAPGPSFWQNSNILHIRGGTGGIKIQPQAGGADLLTLSDAGLLSVLAAGTHRIGTTSPSGLAELSVEGGAAAGQGGIVKLIRGSATVGWVGSESALTGGLTDALTLYSPTAHGITIRAAVAGGTIRFYAEGSARIAQISNAGYSQVAWITTGAAANAYVADNDIIQRSTSSLRYKKDVVTLDGERAKAIVAALRPITYRGINNGETRFPGFAAEEVAELEPMLVTYDKEGRPDYVMYDRIASYLIPVIQEQEARIKTLEARLNNGK